MKETERPAPALPQDGFLRVKQVLCFIPISRSGWWAGVASGRYPKPVRLGPKTTAWRASDIKALIDRLGAGEAA
jgi:predicted DNA-binding transcriptional regulator AlpA